MHDDIRTILNRIAAEHGTPCYVYFLDQILRRAEDVEQAFEGRFAVSYAVKANPNVELLRRLRPTVPMLDISSGGELTRALEAGYAPQELSFSGPAKRPEELRRAGDLGCEVVCESTWEMDQLNRMAAERGEPLAVLIRINPSRMPRKFGVGMAGRAGQFGIDEEELDPVLKQLERWRHLRLRGFHVYSGTNCLVPEAIGENFAILIELFHRFCTAHSLRPEKLIFGSGFGIPYDGAEKPLCLDEVAAAVCPQIDAMKNNPLLSSAQCVLEMGRFLVGPAGYFLTSVVNEKRSRGMEIRMCDGGMNAHLGACGLMGSVIRRNWPMWKVNAVGNQPTREYWLVGPLCTTIDTLAYQVQLPKLHRGDAIAIGSSGAYGLTASPTRFISHPEPREYLVLGNGGGGEIVDISETRSPLMQEAFCDGA
ncbi:MAG: type III PLP-dependent enzyme [Pirellulales bacterium]|nr:type III PLP-dependent enzyme [Pirellulales bacterium]